MDIDSRSPLVQQQPIKALLPSPELNEIEKAFNDHSPIPAAKKRLIYDDPSSPLSSVRPVAPIRPQLEKAATTTSIFAAHSSRRRTISRRPSYASVNTANAAAAIAEEAAKPAPTGLLGQAPPRDASGRRLSKARRALSVCGQPSLFPVEADADDSDDMDDVSSPSVKPPRRAAHSSAGSIEEEALAGSAGRRVHQSGLNLTRSPSEFHFGSEAEGKILPCFSVKEDGLMRISPNTVRLCFRLVNGLTRKLRSYIDSSSTFWKDVMTRS
jgi:M-phase inducer tyrosine phosphatase